MFMICSVNATAPNPLADRFPTSFEEFRDAWAAEETRKGLAAAMHRAILRLLNALVALLAEARAERAAVAVTEGGACDASAAADSDVCDTDADCGGDAEVNPRIRLDGGQDDAVATEHSLTDATSSRGAGEETVAGGGARDALTDVPRQSPLTLPHRAPFLPAKMGTRRRPLPLPQGERDSMCNRC